MSKTAGKLALSLALLVLSVPLLMVNVWLGLGIPVGLVLSVLYGLDLAQELRNAPDPSRMIRAAGLLMGVPQALFGLLCLLTGMGMVAWVLYNTFVERQPQYSGGFLALGAGPALVLFGLGWLASAFRRNPSGPVDEV